MTAQTADPADGRIERDADGSPTGTLHEGAMDLVAQFLPDGKHFLYTQASGGSPDMTLMVGHIDTGSVKSLFKTTTRVQYAEPGYLLFVRDRTLVAQKFDVGSLNLSGEPVPLGEGLGSDDVGLASFSVSRTGILVFRGGELSGSRLVWMDRSGKETPLLDTGGDFRDTSLSPDGTRLVYDVSEGGGSRGDLWIRDLVRNASNHRGPWPKLSVWHGSADRTVNPANADEIVKQWLDVHQLPSAPMSEATVDGYPIPNPASYRAHSPNFFVNLPPDNLQTTPHDMVAHRTSPTNIGLYLLGVPYWLTFGVFTGAVAIIPFFGTLVSSILPALFVLGGPGVFGMGPETHALLVIILGFLIHILEANFVVPIITAKQVEIPPVLSIMAVLVVGRLLGPIGLPVAVPLLAVVIVVVRRVLINRIYDAQGAQAVSRAGQGRVLVLRVPAADGGVLVTADPPLDVLRLSPGERRSA